MGSKKKRGRVTVAAAPKDAPRQHIRPDKKKTGAPASMINWLLMLVVVLPLLFSRVTMDSNISTRYIFLNGFLLVFLLFFYLAKKELIDLSFPPLVKWIFFAGLAFCAWNIISMSQATNIAAGYYETGRHFANLVLLFVVMIAVRREESKLLRLCKALTLMSIVHGLIGIFQYYQLGFTNIPGFFEPYGLMANRNLFGSALVLLIPFISFVLYKGAQPWKIVSAVAFFIVIIGLLLSQTRSAWIAAVLLLIVALVLVLIFSPPNRKRWIMVSAGALAVFVAMAVLIVKADTGGALSQSLQQRFSSFTQQAPDTSAAFKNESERMKMWKRTIGMIKDHPVLGVGPDNWRIAIGNYSPGDMIWADSKVVPDRPHNLYLQTASETGMVGAVLYFSVWLMLALVAFRVIIKPGNEERRIVVILMLAGMAAFASDSMFSFPAERMEHSLYFILMGGIILGAYLNSRADYGEKAKPVDTKLTGLVALLLIFNLVVGIKKYNFEVHMNRAFDFDQAKRYAEVIEETAAGKTMFVTISPYGTPLELYSGIAYKSQKNYDKALEELNRARQYNPTNAKTYNNIGSVYAEMKQYDKAIEQFNKALVFSPRFEIPIRNLAEIYYYQQNYAACIEVLRRINIEKNAYLKNLLKQAQDQLAAKSEQAIGNEQ